MSMKLFRRGDVLNQKHNFKMRGNLVNAADYNGIINRLGVFGKKMFLMDSKPGLRAQRPFRSYYEIWKNF